MLTSDLVCIPFSILQSTLFSSDYDRHIFQAKLPSLTQLLACICACIGWSLCCLYLPLSYTVCVLWERLCIQHSFLRACVHIVHVCIHTEQHHHQLPACILFTFSPLWPSKTSHNLPPSLPCRWCRHFQGLFPISSTSWATLRLTWSWTRNPFPIRINTEIWAAPPMCLNPTVAPLAYWCM